MSLVRVKPQKSAWEVQMGFVMSSILSVGYFPSSRTCFNRTAMVIREYIGVEGVSAVNKWS